MSKRPYRRLNFVGMRFGYLQVRQELEETDQLVCDCDCGGVRKIHRKRIKRVVSCGCKNYKTQHKHGHAKRAYKNKGTPTYTTWLSMHARCTNKNLKCFSGYGARGIKVCKRWADYKNFLKDMGERPEGTSLDRVNTNGNYSPSNCRWATAKQQSYNRRGHIQSKSKYKGVTFCGTQSSPAWRARITVDGTLSHIGVFKSEKEAAKAYNKEASNIWGRYAHLNDV